MQRLRRTGIALIAVLALSLFLVSASFNTSNAYASSSFASTNLYDPSLHNLAGEKITTVEAGQQAMIRVPVHNNAQTERSMVILVEVRDGNGVSAFIAWQITTIPANSDYTAEMSWTPHAECSTPNEACSNYEIRSFGISSLANPEVLSHVAVSDRITVTGSPPIPSGPEYYDLIVNDKTFRIDYSFSGGGGRITDIQVDVETISMLFSVVAPADGTLTISTSEEAAEYLFPDNKENELYAFVDEVAVDLTKTIDSTTGSLILEIPVKQGTQEIEIVENILI